MSRVRSGVVVLLRGGAALVLAMLVVHRAARGAWPEAVWPVTAAIAFTWMVSRRDLFRATELRPLLLFLWSAYAALWIHKDETLLGAAAAVPTIASACLVALHARTYLASGLAPCVPADPVLAARRRLQSIPLWTLAGLALAATVVLALREAVLAWPGAGLALLLGVLAWLTRRDALRSRWTLVAAGLLGLVYVAAGAFVLIGPPRGPHTMQVIVVAAALLLILALVAQILAGRPPEPPPVPSPEPNR